MSAAPHHGRMMLCCVPMLGVLVLVTVPGLANAGVVGVLLLFAAAVATVMALVPKGRR